ncbi:hypothetical protein BJ684DRAFT_15859 [Piptocephalis cylindrospora]|uniref:Uncharacterized protein n=1 Tax=Piptocephalis cylindrospora TaxID=1907219 RepID=A0A4P9Y4I1_9FUNG|nr:hypothetical protein BJ684DRAFT_15859 [Piptocephalis cylindrospora]|eukprot:RKP13773.1 hypothetical protein BJ684DRAFT_15859 [Piptocephalis cylindrospora]
MHSIIAVALISLVPALSAFPSHSLYMNTADEAFGQNACGVQGGCGGALTYQFPMQPPGRMVQPAPLAFQPNPARIQPPAVRVTSEVRTAGPPQAFSVGQGSLQEGSSSFRVLGQGVTSTCLDDATMQQPQLSQEELGGNYKGNKREDVYQGKYPSGEDQETYEQTQPQYGKAQYGQFTCPQASYASKGISAC